MKKGSKDMRKVHKKKFFKQISFIHILFVPLCLFALTSCQTTSRPWEYSGQQQQAAQQPPKTLRTGSSNNPIYVNDNQQKKPTIQRFDPQGRAANTDSQNNAPPQNQLLTYQQPAQQPSNMQALTSNQVTKVGVLLPLSGQHKDLGQAMLHAAQLALFDVGHENLKLIPRDTKGTPQGARQAAQSLVQDGAQLILGPVFAESVRAAKPITQNARINMIAYSTNWTLAGGNTFIMGFLPFDQMGRIMDYAANQNIKRIAVFAPDTDYGQSVVSAYRSLVPATGLMTVDIQTFPANTNNLSPSLRSFTRYDEREAIVKRQKISPLDVEAPYDALLMPVGGDTAISIANLLSHYDLPPSKVKRIGTGLFDDPALANEQSLGGSWFAAPSPNGRRNFESRFQELYNYTPPRLASLSYDSTALAAILSFNGLQTKGHPAYDFQSITNPNGFAGIDGIFRFRSDGLVERGLAVLSFEAGRIRVIDEAPKTFEQPSRF